MRRSSGLSVFSLARVICEMLGSEQVEESSPPTGEAVQPGVQADRQTDLYATVCPVAWFPTVGTGQPEPALSKLWFPYQQNENGNSCLQVRGSCARLTFDKYPGQSLEHRRNAADTFLLPHSFPVLLLVAVNMVKTTAATENFCL